MASYKHLRGFIKRVAPPTDHVLKNCHVVIDGKTFFKDTYKNSGCKSILGGEYDRYAEYLRCILKRFIESNVTCYVIFNGAMDAPLEKRAEIEQNVINRADAITGENENAYCETIFLKDIWKEILDELEIAYYVTEYDSNIALFRVANMFRCPIVTKNYQYCLRYSSCIPPQSVEFDEKEKQITCKIFDSKNCRSILRVRHGLLPLFFTLTDDNSIYFKRLADIVDSVTRNVMGSVLRWIRKQWYELDDNMKKILQILTEEEADAFMKAYEYNQELVKNTTDWDAVKHFGKGKGSALFENDTKWFISGVSSGRIAIPYVNLANKGTFSGSWVAFDEDKEDAMLSALDIIFYVYGILTNRQELNITFIGRKEKKSSIWEIKKKFDKPISNKELFTERQTKRGRQDKTQTVDLFEKFVQKVMPDINVLKSAPEDCWILIITLAYYWQKNTDIILAYSVILSYIMLGPVSDRVGLIRRSNFISPDVAENDRVDDHGLTYEDCVTAANALMDLFYVKNLKSQFHRSILHAMAEFQHCLQHMNYLNKLCGQKIACTVYHKTIDATFMYNIYIKMKDKSNPTKYIEKRLKKSSVFDYYQKIVSIFESCLQSRG